MEQTYVQAVNSALRQEMHRDPRVYVLGEDVSVGGPFGATKGLADAFGAGRVVDTPISEGAVMGLATGAAVLGYRPVVEIMFMDFITLATDALVNHAAKYRYMSGGQFSVPMVVRAQFGAAGGFGPQHSQSLEAWLFHVPGLKLVAPSTPADAKGLLAAAIRDDDPVVVIEHRALYYLSGGVPDEEHVASLGRSAVRRAGSDVTVIAYSHMVRTALAAAALLAERGIEAEVIDLRTLVPLDLDTVVTSVRKTHRAVIACESVAQGGVGSALAASIQQLAFDELDAPVTWVGAPFCPVPASPALEARYVLTDARLAAAVQQVTGSG